MKKSIVKFFLYSTIYICELHVEISIMYTDIENIIEKRVVLHKKIDRK